MKIQHQLGRYVIADDVIDHQGACVVARMILTAVNETAAGASAGWRPKHVELDRDNHGHWVFEVVYVRLRPGLRQRLRARIKGRR